MLIRVRVCNTTVTHQLQSSYLVWDTFKRRKEGSSGIVQYCPPGPATIRVPLTGEAAARTITRKWTTKQVITKLCAQLPCERLRGKQLASYYSVQVSRAPELLQWTVLGHHATRRKDRQAGWTTSAMGSWKILPPPTLALSGLSKAFNHSAFSHLWNANKDSTIFVGCCRHIIHFKTTFRTVLKKQTQENLTDLKNTYFETQTTEYSLILFTQEKAWKGNIS